MQTTALPIDFEALIELMGGNRDGVCSLLGIFVDELSADLDASTVAVEADDRARLQQIAHRLKGASATLYASTLSAAASELEQSCKEANVAGLRANHQRVVDQVTRVEEAIACWLDVGSTTEG